MKDFAKIHSCTKSFAEHLCTCVREATPVVTQQGKAALWVHTTVAGKANRQVTWQRPRCGVGVASVLVWGRMPRCVDRLWCNILLSFVVRERHTRHSFCVVFLLSKPSLTLCFLLSCTVYHHSDGWQQPSHNQVEWCVRRPVV